MTQIQNVILDYLVGEQVVWSGIEELQRSSCRMICNSGSKTSPATYRNRNRSSTIIYSGDRNDFIVKNHSFTDGNKRIAAAIFVWFLERHNFLYNTEGEKRIADNALVAFTLLIAESKPEEREMMVKVIINLINGNNA